MQETTTKTHPITPMVMKAECEAEVVHREPTAADRAVAHLLSRMATDASVARIICPLTETFTLLCAAESEYTGVSIDVVKRKRSEEHYAHARREMKGYVR